MKREEGLDILIVEDNMMARFLIRLSLDEAQITGNIVEACNGKEAIDSITSNSKTPDLILLDLHMPVMDGVQFLEAFRDSGFYQKEALIFALSCEESGAFYDRVMNTKMVKNFFPKPFTETHARQIHLSLGGL